MNQYDLTIRDVQVQDTTGFDRSGSVLLGKRVTFYVGDHGPFMLSYPTRAEASTARIKSDMDVQVQQLKELTGQ